MGCLEILRKTFHTSSLLLFGGAIGVFGIGNILKVLFDSFPTQTSFCFIGLILGSIPILMKQVNSEHTFKLRYLIFTVIAFIFGYFLVVLENKINFENALIVKDFSFEFLVFSGFLMSIGIVVPGVSNTLILMCLRSI